MAAEALTASASASASASMVAARRPYSPSWVDLASERIDALPGPVWPAYLVLAIFAIGLAPIQGWLAGLVVPPAVDLRQSTTGLDGGLRFVMRAARAVGLTFTAPGGR